MLPSGAMMGVMWFWMFLLMTITTIWLFLGPPADEHPQVAVAEPRMIPEEEQPQQIRELMDVRVATEENDAKIFRGQLQTTPSKAIESLKAQYSDRYTPLLQEDGQLGSAIILLPGRTESTTVKASVRPALHWLLFGLTILTTTLAGAAHQGINLIAQPGRISEALPYSLGLLAILGVHELGHYFAARRHGMNVTPPYFIPVPFALGTFGAFIQMRSPSENRRALFDVAVAGPLAGLAIAIPALLIGLRSSSVIPPDLVTESPSHLFGGTSAASSILFALLSKISLGNALQEGHLLQLSPLAFAGWLGLIVTALNLLPIGQLDGGHIARAMFGQRIGSSISSLALWTLFLLALFVWPGLMMWAIIVFFLAGKSSPPLDDLTPLSPSRRRLGFVTFAILLLIIVPLPHAFWNAAGFHCPYL